MGVEINMRVEPNDGGKGRAAIAARRRNACKAARRQRVIAPYDEGDTASKDRLTHAGPQDFADFNDPNGSLFDRCTARMASRNGVTEIGDLPVKGEASGSNGRGTTCGAGATAAVIRGHANEVNLRGSHGSDVYMKRKEPRRPS